MSKIKISISIEADDIDAVVHELLERFTEREPLPKPAPKLEDVPPATSIPVRRIRIVKGDGDA